MNEELLRFKPKQRYVFFDTETEGLNLIGSRPWQLAWIVVENKKVIKKEDRYIQWDDLNISDDAAKITGFSRQIYNKRAEDPAKVLSDFEKDISDPDTIVAGHNVLRFDVYMYNVVRANLGLDPDYSFLPRVVDTISLAIAIQKGIPFDRENRIEWMYKMSSIRERSLKTTQKTLLKNYDIPFDEGRLHDALYDIEKNYELFLKQIYDIEI